MKTFFSDSTETSRNHRMLIFSHQIVVTYRIHFPGENYRREMQCSYVERLKTKKIVATASKPLLATIHVTHRSIHSSFPCIKILRPSTLLLLSRSSWKIFSSFFAGAALHSNCLVVVIGRLNSVNFHRRFMLRWTLPTHDIVFVYHVSTSLFARYEVKKSRTKFFFLLFFFISIILI